MDRTTVMVPGNVALVTGAAMGIGKAACIRFAELGMNVCVVDLPGERLDSVVEDVIKASPKGADAIVGFSVDVSDPQQIQKLHDDVIARFGKVNLLMNNAVTRIGKGHDADIAEWRQAMEINFWGVVYGTQAFLPDMLASDEPGLIINCGSKQGITNPPGHPIYNITKSALKTYTEGLEYDIRNDENNQGAHRVTAHLLIPGWTTTRDQVHQQGAWMPVQVIDFMCAALNKGDFYILCPDDETSTDMDHRRVIYGAQDITKNRPPLSRWHKDYAASAKEQCS